MTQTPIMFKVFDSDAMEFVDDERLIYFTLSDMRYDDPYNFMQLTALRSTNDEPIYNHMIVKARHEEYAYTKHYMVDMFNYKVMAYLSDCSLEIVGNRFQSPELLELCK
jgi:hypothetical protein